MTVLLAIGWALGAVGLALLIGRAVRLGDQRDAAIARITFLPTIAGPPARALVHDGPLTEERAEAIRQQWAEMYGRPRRDPLLADPWLVVLRTHAEVVERLPSSIREDFEPVAPRSWLTPAEAREHDGPLVEVRNLADPEPRFLPTDGGIVR